MRSEVKHLLCSVDSLCLMYSQWDEFLASRMSGDSEILEAYSTLQAKDFNYPRY